LNFFSKNGFERFHPVNILVRCEYHLYYLWQCFKHNGDSQFLEIFSTSKEVMSPYDHGVVVFRFGLSCNESCRIIALPYLLVDGGL
jgi:hypothetical protein